MNNARRADRPQATAAFRMTNIPTELLRTLVTMVDLRSFTKAAHALGMTQPAVSAQIKRLQVLLGGELLDKSAPGVSLTPKGDAVVQQARRLLAVNDQIVGIAQPARAPGLRIGISDEALSAMMGLVLSACRDASTGSFEVRGSDDLLRDLVQGELDLAIALGDGGCETPYRWSEPLTWVCSPGLAFHGAGPLPLVLADTGEIARLATAALTRSGAEWQAACRVPSYFGSAAAVMAGLGTAVMLRRFVPPELSACEDPRLPPLPELTCGIYLRAGAEEPRIAKLADALAETLRSPASAAPAADRTDVEEPATALQPEH